MAVGAWPMEGLLLIVAGGLWLAIWMARWRWFGLVAVVLGLAVLPFARVPDVLIAADGDNVAVRDADGALHLLSSRRGRFDAEIWLRRDGDSREVSAVTKDDESGFVCDPAGCVARVAGRTPLLVAFSAEALVEDCPSVVVVVDLARGWRPPCDGPHVFVARGLLRREGAIEMRLEDGRVVWTSVARERGARPWTGSAQ